MAGELVPGDFTHGYYEFDGQIGGEIVDLSAAGFNLTVVGATDVSTGKFGNGLEFDGLNDNATSAQARYSDFTDQLGMCGWMQLLRTSTGVDGYIWKGLGSAGGQDFVLFGVSDSIGWFRVNDGGTQAQSGSLITTSHFFVMNYNGLNAAIHWDDPSINSNSIAKSGNIRDTGSLNIGAVIGNIQNAQMRISQLGIRNAPFTADEMNYMYNGGAGRLLAPIAAGGGQIVNGGMAGPQLINGGIISV